ncbi:MAG: metallophosphoesterase [Thermoleophilia bacterium]|nr:metallophosphoesterase [Thermoleophilia bacterium]
MTRTVSELSARRIHAARIIHVLFAAATIAATILVAYYSLILVSPTDITVGPVRLEFSLKSAWHGKSVVNLPPAGSIEADTHSGPVLASFSLQEISVNDVGDLTDPGSQARLALDNWREPLGREAQNLVIKTIIICILAGGAVAGLLQRRWQWVLAGMAIGLMTVLMVGGLVYGTYDTSAFREPRYSGSLTYAPEVLAFSQDTLANLNTYKDRVPEIADSLYRTISELHQLPQAPPEEDTIRVLHISDMHSSSDAAKLVKTVVDRYNIDFIIDTGDLTEFGTSFEIKYPSTYLPLLKPYVWIGGNHDSPLVTRSMQSIPGVTVLDSQFEQFDGIIVGGFPDPGSRSLNPQPASDAEMASEAARIAGLVDVQKPRPFIVAVHDPKASALLNGRVPVVVDGHTHRQGITVENGTVFLDAGSTGGGNLRSFNHDGEIPSSLQVLYIRKEPQKLVAVDTVIIYRFSQEFSVTRRVFAVDEGLIRDLELREAAAVLSG